MLLRRSSFYYRSRRKDHVALKMRLRDLAMVRVRFGYRHLTVLLKREGWPVGKNWFIGCIGNWACRCAPGRRRKLARLDENGRVSHVGLSVLIGLSLMDKGVVRENKKEITLGLDLVLCVGRSRKGGQRGKFGQYARATRKYGTKLSPRHCGNGNQHAQDPWVSRFLQELGLRVIVANPRKLIKGQIGDQAFQSAVLFFQIT